MASDKGAVASGADFESTARRRNVPSTSPNGGLVNRVEIDEKKAQVKKVSDYNSARYGQCCMLQSKTAKKVQLPADRTNIHTIPRRMGVHHCPSHIHNTRILHKIIQDWSFAHRYVG
jgi:hypothetical protein